MKEEEMKPKEYIRRMTNGCGIVAMKCMRENIHWKQEPQMKREYASINV